MTKPISKLFRQLGWPLRHTRWSWGATAGQVMLLRTWNDEHSHKDRTVIVLKEPDKCLQSESYGLDERIVQLQAMWAGGVAA